MRKALKFLFVKLEKIKLGLGNMKEMCIRNMLFRVVAIIKHHKHSKTHKADHIHRQRYKDAKPDTNTRTQTSNKCISVFQVNS